MHTNMRIEPASLELSGLLAERASLTAAVNKAIVARALVKKVLAPHLWSVEARVHALAPSQAEYQRAQGTARSTRCFKYITLSPYESLHRESFICLLDRKERLTGRASVDDLRDLAEGDAVAEASYATCSNRQYREIIQGVSQQSIYMLKLMKVRMKNHCSCRRRRSNRRGQWTTAPAPETGFGKHSSLVEGRTGLLSSPGSRSSPAVPTKGAAAAGSTCYYQLWDTFWDSQRERKGGLNFGIEIGIGLRREGSCSYV